MTTFEALLDTYISFISSFLKAFRDNVSKFESKHGEIKLPNHDDGLSPFGVKPPDETIPN